MFLKIMYFDVIFIHFSQPGGSKGRNDTPGSEAATGSGTAEGEQYACATGTTNYTGQLNILSIKQEVKDLRRISVLLYSQMC